MGAPCWQKLLTDSYDGAIGGRYPIACYHRAIEHISIVDQIYGGTRDEILRSLQTRIRVSPVHTVATTHGGGPPRLLIALAAFAILLLATSAAEALRRRLRKRPNS